MKNCLSVLFSYSAKHKCIKIKNLNHHLCCHHFPLYLLSVNSILSCGIDYCMVIVLSKYHKQSEFNDFSLITILRFKQKICSTTVLSIISFVYKEPYVIFTRSYRSLQKFLINTWVITYGMFHLYLKMLVIIFKYVY